MNIKYVSFEEISAFISSQPDEKEIQFDVNERQKDSELCGCLMIQYHNSIQPETNKVYCGFDYSMGISCEEKFRFNYDLRVERLVRRGVMFQEKFKTYGDVKKILDDY